MTEYKQVRVTKTIHDKLEEIKDDNNFRSYNYTIRTLIQLHSNKIEQLKFESALNDLEECLTGKLEENDKSNLRVFLLSTYRKGKLNKNILKNAFLRSKKGD